MGGKGSGGARPGSGRKGKTDAERWLDGNSSHGTRPPAIPVPAVVLEPPFDLLPAERVVWVNLAPHATAARTLTPGTAAAFRDLVEAIVMKQTMLARVAHDGLMAERDIVDEAGGILVERKAHVLLNHLRGWMQRVEAGMLRFRLSPMGKELTASAAAVEAADPFAEFDTPTGPTN